MLLGPEALFSERFAEFGQGAFGIPEDLLELLLDRGYLLVVVIFGGHREVLPIGAVRDAHQSTTVAKINAAGRTRKTPSTHTAT